MVAFLPPALVEAIDDPILEGVPRGILFRCWIWLEPYGFRPLTRQTVARAFRIEEKTAARCLELLIEGGYLQRGPDGEHGIRTYRVLLTRTPLR